MADEAPQPPSDPVFQGFDMPRQNWFKMPNSWTNITANISSLAELKVIEYVLKHTWGYREYGLNKRITTDEFMHGRRLKDGTRMDLGTGLSKPSVVAGLKSAVAHGYLEEITNDSDLARIKKYYSLKMLPGAAADDEPIFQENSSPTPEETSEISGVKNLNSDVKNLNIGVNLLNIGGKESLHRSEKDTLERHQQTDTKNNNSNTPPNDRVVVALLDQGISRPVARRLARTFSADYILLKLDYLEFLLGKRPHEVKKPAAWLRKAIEDDYSAPDGYVSQEERQRHTEDKKRRNRAVLKAQERDRELRDADEKARAEKMAAKRERLHAQYGTTPEDITFWETALKDLSFTTTGGVHALIATAEILKVAEDRVIVGIPHQFQFQQLQHPGYQAALKRTFKQLTRRPLGLELVLIADVVEPISGGAATVDE
jgi:hypothetical protein